MGGILDLIIFTAKSFFLSHSFSLSHSLTLHLKFQFILFFKSRANKKLCVAYEIFIFEFSRVYLLHIICEIIVIVIIMIVAERSNND